MRCWPVVICFADPNCQIAFSTFHQRLEAASIARGINDALEVDSELSVKKNTEVVEGGYKEMQGTTWLN